MGPPCSTCGSSMASRKHGQTGERFWFCRKCTENAIRTAVSKHEPESDRQAETEHLYEHVPRWEG